MLNMETRDAVFSYHFTNIALALLGLETLIVAIVAGVNHNIGIGIMVFIIVAIIWAIKPLGGVLALFFSFTEAGMLAMLLQDKTAGQVAWFIGIFSFFVFVALHKHIIKLTDSVFGYSLVIFEALMIAGSVAVLVRFDSLVIPVLLFGVLLACSFIPVVRVVEMVLMVLLLTVFFFLVVSQDLSRGWAFAASACVMVYFGYLHYMAASLIHYKDIFTERRREREYAADEQYFQELEDEVYDIWPELEKEHYYYETVVCHTDAEQDLFEMDWLDYLEYLRDGGEFISFNQYFEMNQLYRTHKYNRDFAERFAGAGNDAGEGEADYTKETKEAEGEQFESLFAGVRSAQELHKRYKDLLKIYHPDNQGGDTSMTQRIQEVYRGLLKGWE